MVKGKLLTAHLWDRYTNKNHPILYFYLVNAMLLHHYVLYDLTLQHIDLYGNSNGKGVYHHFATGNNMSTLRCYQVCKNGETSNYHKVKTCCFWSNRLYNTFTQKPGLESQFEINDEKCDIKYDRTTKTNIKKGSDNVNEQVSKTAV